MNTNKNVIDAILRSKKIFYWLLGILAILLIVNGMAEWESWTNTKPATAVSTLDGVTLVTSFHADNNPRLDVTFRQRGQFNVGITAKTKNFNYEEPFMGMDSVTVKPLSNDSFYRIRVFVPNVDHRPKAVFDRDVWYNEDLKKFVFQ